MTPHLLILPLNHLVLYPYDAAADTVPIRAEVHLPAGWKFDGALHPQRVEGDTLFLPVVSLSTLVDSPILAGEYLDRKSTRLNSIHVSISYAVFCLKKKRLPT